MRIILQMEEKTKELIDRIRQKIRRAHFNDALDELDMLIEMLDNRELERMFTVLSARYNIELKEYVISSKLDDVQVNQIIDAIQHLLNEAELIASENYSIIRNRSRNDEKEEEAENEYVQIEKIAYIKFIHLKERKEGILPVYTRYIPRLDKKIPVYDETHLFRIIKYSKPLDEIHIRDRSSGIVDINILHPWQELEFTDYGSAHLEEMVTQVIDMMQSNVFCSTMSFFNCFQKGNTDFMTQMEMKTKTGRLIMDFSSIPGYENFIRGMPSGFRRIRGFDENRKVAVEEIRPGVFHLESVNLNRGDVIGMKFDLDWAKVQ